MCLDSEDQPDDEEFPFVFPTDECVDCCAWAVPGKERCVFHTHNPAKE